MKDLGKPFHPIEPYDFPGKSIEQSIEEIRTLDIDTQFSWENNWEALKNWRRYLEDLGIFVFQVSMPIDEIRGFSLIRENYPPAIVINSKDSPNGRIFTLFHEYCHILLNEAGETLEVRPVNFRGQASKSGKSREREDEGRERTRGRERIVKSQWKGCQPGRESLQGASASGKGGWESLQVASSPVQVDSSSVQLSRVKDLEDLASAPHDGAPSPGEL